VDGVLRFALKSLPAVASDAKDPAPGLELGCARAVMHRCACLYFRLL